jgi:hypothetical protein
MASDPTAQSLRGLILSAEDLRSLTEWTEPVIEDYLTLFENLITLSEEIDTKAALIKETTTVTTTPYTPLATDQDIFVDTTLMPITVTLPAGVDGANYRIINVGTAGNDVTLTPSLLELLFGVNDAEKIADEEVLIMTYESTYGWY